MDAARQFYRNSGTLSLTYAQPTIAETLVIYIGLYLQALEFLSFISIPTDDRDAKWDAGHSCKAYPVTSHAIP